MQVAQMRSKLMDDTKYSKSIRWQNRVKSMSDAQVIAIYHRILAKNEFKNCDDGEQLKLSVF